MQRFSFGFPREKKFPFSYQFLSEQIDIVIHVVVLKVALLICALVTYVRISFVLYVSFHINFFD